MKKKKKKKKIHKWDIPDHCFEVFFLKKKDFINIFCSYLISFFRPLCIMDTLACDTFALNLQVRNCGRAKPTSRSHLIHPFISSSPTPLCVRAGSILEKWVPHILKVDREATSSLSLLTPEEGQRVKLPAGLTGH